MRVYCRTKTWCTFSIRHLYICFVQPRLSNKYKNIQKLGTFESFLHKYCQHVLRRRPRDFAFDYFCQKKKNTHTHTHTHEKNKCGIKIEEVSSSVLYNVVIAALRTNTNRDIKLLCHWNIKYSEIYWNNSCGPMFIS